ncbi:guanine(37)-N1-methyltransferase [Fimicolochytrium jonesii]|uniref:guanine(37)-N1-methyltransferase n=1 Tax=Fimicolochytrium jonesii TaxID=1396493 RepID=UPI0022FDFDC5|nr:guanine(37)-N1-methyltransferase [Fimicolochytrium jonesii]KAI8822562.1 guanine(37)-N1-methyltransferase [Fimicolochytrium jonesii]
MSLSLAPPANKGLSKLNRDLFKQTLELTALRLPAPACARAMKELKGGYILEVPRLRGIVEDPADLAAGETKKAARRLLLLNPLKAVSKDSLPTPVKEFATRENAEITQYRLDLDYDYWTSEQVLRSILPDDIDVPGAYEAVGHIAHLNLRDQFLPYKSIIGEVLLDKNKSLRTIVNKTGNIDNTFRFFEMELLAGENDLMAELNESNCKFRFDFSRVYWNSRLQGEHERIVKKFKKNGLVCDVMAGVGPYAVPAAKNKKLVVFANDLNPSSYEFLCENIKINKVEHLVKPYNMDGRDFVWQSLDDLNSSGPWDTLRSKIPPSRRPRGSKATVALDGSPNIEEKDLKAPAPVSLGPLEPKAGFRWFDHYVMNLPATAIEFLDAFRGLFHNREIISQDKLPIIHCHCFSKEEDPSADVIKRVEKVIGASLGSNLIEVHNVRNVAPNKEMLCISFRLPSEVAYAEPEALR